jgi:hypothetical protein
MEHNSWLRRRDIKDNRLIDKVEKVAGDYLNDVAAKANSCKSFNEKAYWYKIAANVENYLAKMSNPNFKVFLVDHNLYDGVGTVTLKPNCIELCNIEHTANTVDQAIDKFLNS